MTIGKGGPGDLDGELASLGIRSLHEWDSLVFLYRHRTSLLSSEDIASLLGYPTGAVVLALESLEQLGLVLRSRSAQGVRLYQIALPGDPGSARTLDRLMALAGDRSLRLGLFKKLGRTARDPPSGEGKGGEGRICLKLIASKRASTG